MSTHTVEPSVGQVARPAVPRAQPRRAPFVVPVAVVLALGLIAIAVVAVRELLVSQGWAAGSVVVPDLVAGPVGLSPSVGLAVAGGAVALVGLVLLWLALRPGRRTHLRASGGADLWIAPGAVAAVAQETADRLPGVVSADSSRSTRRHVVVDVVVAAPRTADAPQETVTEHVRAVLDEEIGRPTGAGIKVRATEVPR